MREFQGVTFDKTRVVLDDTEFTDCKITNCEVIYAGGSFRWTNTAMSNCFPVLCGSAALTVSLLGQLGLIDVTEPQWKAVTLEIPPSEKSVN
jgi:hypothetical protein